MTTEIIETLIRRSRLPTGYILPDGASESEINRFETEIGFPLHPELREWLAFCNSSLLGMGGTYGIGRQLQGMSIELLMEPEWIQLKWIPIAGDGCGNRYVVDCANTKYCGFVYFVDSLAPERIAYACASGVERFIQFYLLRDIGETGWPHDRDSVLALDPKLDSIPADLLLWNEK